MIVVVAGTVCKDVIQAARIRGVELRLRVTRGNEL